MKLLIAGLGLIGSASAAADFDCVVDCYRDVFRNAIKCDLMEDATEDEKAQCHEDVFREFWLVNRKAKFISGTMCHHCLGSSAWKVVAEQLCPMVLVTLVAHQS